MANKSIQGLLLIILTVVLLFIFMLATFPLEMFALFASIFLIYYFRKWDSETKYISTLNKFNVDSLDTLSGTEFEIFLEKMLKSLGYDAKVTGKSGDQGADLIVETNQDRIIVQAKRYSNKVNNKAIQEAVTAMAIYNANKAWVITTNYFQNSAIEAGQANNVKLTDRDELNKMIQDAYSSGLKAKVPLKGIDKFLTKKWIFVITSITILIALTSIIISFESTLNSISS